MTETATDRIRIVSGDITEVAAFVADDDHLDEVLMIAFDGNVEAALKASLRKRG